MVIVLPGPSSGIRPVKTSLPTAVQPSVAEKLGRAMCRNIALPAPANDRLHVVSDADHQIVNLVVAPQSFGSGRIGKGNKAVVSTISGIVDPRVVWCQRAHWQSRGRSLMRSSR